MHRIQPPDWDNLRFQFYPTPYSYRAEADVDRDPIWSPGELLERSTVELPIAAAALSYGYGVFEGLKARRTTGGRLVLFRPTAHGARLARSAERLSLPPFAEEQFVEACSALVAANRAFVPPAEAGSLYLRPLQLADEPMLGLRPTHRCSVLIYASPVGDYFSDEQRARGLRLRLADVTRAPPGGTGGAKAIGNYAGTLYHRREAQRAGYDEVLYLDASGGRLLQETSGSNVFCALDSGELVTPELGDTVLAGITRDSVLTVARELGVTTRERPLALQEVLDAGRELFCTGTAWTIRSVDAIGGPAGERRFTERRLAERIAARLGAIQRGDHDDPHGWLHEISL